MHAHAKGPGASPPAQNQPKHVGMNVPAGSTHPSHHHHQSNTKSNSQAGHHHKRRTTLIHHHVPTQLGPRYNFHAYGNVPPPVPVNHKPFHQKKFPSMEYLHSHQYKFPVNENRQFSTFYPRGLSMSDVRKDFIPMFRQYSTRKMGAVPTIIPTYLNQKKLKLHIPQYLLDAMSKEERKKALSRLAEQQAAEDEMLETMHSELVDTMRARHGASVVVPPKPMSSKIKPEENIPSAVKAATETRQRHYSSSSSSSSSECTATETESEEDEGLSFEFRPVSPCAAEVCVTIEPVDECPLEFAIRNGIMPIVSSMSPPCYVMGGNQRAYRKNASLFCPNGNYC